MYEIKKTAIYGGIAILLGALALLMSPKNVTPDAFLDQGQPFFPDFEDPNEATTLEIVSFDEETGAATPFKVTFKENRWTIPSHHDYPADAKDRLAKTAAGVIDIRKDDFRSGKVSDHGATGVVDPLDESALAAGKGDRITLKGVGDVVLADFIVGNEVPGRAGFRFVRLPGQSRVYASRMNLEISTRFEDWIDTDLLQLDQKRISRVDIQDYSINERTRSVNKRDELNLLLKEDKWTAAKMGSGKVIDSTKMTDLLKTVDSLLIVGVRPKPAGLLASLTKAEGETTVSNQDARSLQSKGFYFSRDGSLYSNEGELQVFSSDGVKYTRRFGEVVYGVGESITAGGSEGVANQGPAENRYLFASAEFYAGAFQEPKGPDNHNYLKKDDSTWNDEDRANKSRQEDVDEWNRLMEAGRKRASELNERFAAWYYVISDESFNKLHLSRKELVVTQ